MVSILGANSVSGGYEVSNSLRFNDDDTASLNITQSAGNRDTWTFSAWIKRGNLGTNQVIIISGSGASDYFVLNFNSSDKISWHQYNGSNYDVLETSDAVFRDPSAWYHIVLKVDTTDSTADNRVILYVNGLVASHTANTTFDQNEDTDFNNNGNTLDIGNDAQFNIGYAAFDGYMTEINFIDGTQKAASDFGEFNDNGVWIPKKYSGSYGTNGFFLQFKQTGTSQNSSGIGADTSGEDNHFAVTNLAATDVTTDSPTNNFATLNPLNMSSNITISEGNLKTTASAAWHSAIGTIYSTSGKWYYEFVLTGDSWVVVGAVPTSQDINNHPGTGSGIKSIGLVFSTNSSRGDISYNGSNSVYTDGGHGINTGDIIGVALDLDNNNVKFYKNNTQLYNLSNLLSDEPYTFSVSNYGSAGVSNFGQDGTFAGAKTAQNNADANGYGDFYYSVPSGYYALNTKNLAEYG